jgi:hypothetical protein
LLQAGQRPCSSPKPASSPRLQEGLPPLVDKDTRSRMAKTMSSAMALE